MTDYILEYMENNLTSCVCNIFYLYHKENRWWINVNRLCISIRCAILYVYLIVSMIVLSNTIYAILYVFLFYIYAGVYMYVCVCICMYIYVCVCICMCGCVCTDKYVYFLGVFYFSLFLFFSFLCTLFLPTYCFLGSVWPSPELGSM